MTATTLHLGYLVSGLMFAGLIAVPALAYRLFKMNEVVAFWFAYVVTRPLGASFADWFRQVPPDRGPGPGRRKGEPGSHSRDRRIVGYLTVTRRDVSADAAPSPAPVTDP